MIKRTLQTLALVVILILLDFSAAQGEGLPDSATISGVSGHPQKHSLSCEARSAADLAAFWGVSLGENEFLGTLPRSDNPEQGFVGSPDDTWGSIPPHGYGVHAGPVAYTLQSFGLHARAYNHLGWDDLRGEIAAGRPVIVWIIGQMWGGRAIEYTASDGSTSTVAAFEHTMILTGYTPDIVHVVDAFSGQNQTYALGTFLDSWAVLGKMAVFASLEDDVQPAAPVENTPQTYTVEIGDYLTALANQFGTTWERLVELNSIPYPYTIYPGQVLQLPGSETPAPALEGAVPVAQELAPPVKVVNSQVRLPLVYRNYAVQVSKTAASQADSGLLVQPVSYQDRATPAAVCSAPGVDPALLARMRIMLAPILVNNEQTLLR